MFSELLQQTGLSLDRLQSFCLVAQASGVTKAAKGDPAKQSLFSRQIKELEEFFGTELIRRKGRGVALTEAGVRLNIIARECFASLSDFKNQCKDRPVEVVIGSGESLIQWLLLPRLNEMRGRLPNVRLKFLNLPTDEAIKLLSEGQIDFAVVRQDAVNRPLRFVPLGAIRYSLFLPPSSRAKSARKDSLAVLDGLPLATLEGDGSFRRELTHLAKKHDVNLNVQVECSSFTLAARAVRDGNIAAVLPSIAATEFVGAGATEISLGFFKTFQRHVCLASNVRLARIRPILTKVGTVLSQICRL